MTPDEKFSPSSEKLTFYYPRADWNEDVFKAAYTPGEYDLTVDGERVGKVVIGELEPNGDGIYGVAHFDEGVMVKEQNLHISFDGVDVVD